MRTVRGMVNALLLVTLARPIVRLTVARWRRRAREAAPAVISVPVQELLEAALIEELSAPAVEPELESLAEDVVAETAGRSALRTAVLAGGLITVVAISVAAIAALVRRRRAARADREFVAVPVDSEAAAAIEEAEAIATVAE